MNCNMLDTGFNDRLDKQVRVYAAASPVVEVMHSAHGQLDDLYYDVYRQVWRGFGFVIDVQISNSEAPAAT